MTFLGGSSFSALVCPTGVHLVAYRRTRAGLQVERYNQALRDGLSTDDVAAMLADLLESEGARGRRVSIAVTGFGACHQIVTLPRADRAVLRPVAVRELRRFYPDLFADEEPGPIVDFVELSAGDPAASPQADLLVAGIPRLFVHTVVTALAARGVSVDHWTIAPRVLQRLYGAFAEPERTGAALIMVPGWPLLGFFHERELRLFSEPLSGPSGTHAAGVAAVTEHVERGRIFLRQQFRGAAVSQLYLAAGQQAGGPATGEPTGMTLDLPVAPFGPATEPPGAFAALGAALDGASGDGLNLLPVELRPRTESELWTRRLAVASVCVVLAAAGWWASSARRTEAAARQEIVALTDELSAQRSLFGSVRPIIEERQAHAQRSALIELLARDRRRLPEVLWPLHAAAPVVEVGKLHVARGAEGWEVLLGVTATAPTYELATDAISAVTQRLAAELPEDALAVSAIEMARATPRDSTAIRAGAEDVAASVQMSFIIPTLKAKTE